MTIDTPRFRERNNALSLSKEEQLQLQSIAAALRAEDPRLVGRLEDSSRNVRGRRPARRWLAIGVISSLCGLYLLFLGTSMSNATVGVLGFIAALAGAYLIHSDTGERVSRHRLTSQR